MHPNDEEPKCILRSFFSSLFLLSFTPPLILMTKMNSAPALKPDRKTTERNRRIHMKNLCFKLSSLIPPNHLIKTSKDVLSQQDQLEQAANYIKQLKERIEELKGRKEVAMKAAAGTNDDLINTIMLGLSLPVIDLRELGSSLEVMLISGLNKNFMLYEVINVLEEEGAEVVSASISTVGDKVFHSLHAQVKISRVGVETSRVWQRLQDLIYSTQLLQVD